MIHTLIYSEIPDLPQQVSKNTTYIYIYIYISKVLMTVVNNEQN